MKVLIGVLLIFGFSLLFYEMDFLEKMSRMLQQTRREMNASARQRNLADRQRLEQLQAENSMWYKLEQCLQYSGVRRRFPQVTGVFFIAGNLCLAAAGLVVIGMLTNLTVASIVVAGALVSESITLWILRRHNFHKTEENLTKLLDFLGNYSLTAGELTSVLGQVSRYVEEPIKGALDTCYYEAMTTGDSGKALLAMAERVEHPKFKELARNMEISTRYCADFSQLVSSSRRSLREYLKLSRERKGMLREALINTVLLLGMSLLVLIMVFRLTGIKL